MIYVKDEDLYEHQRMIQYFMINESVLSSALSIDQIIREEPEKAWQIMLVGIKTIPSRILLEDFVEDHFYMFLSLHGKKYIKQFENEVNETPNFSRALEIVLNYESGYWKISEQVLSEIKRILSLKDINLSKKDDITQNIISSWLVYETTSWASNDLDEFVRNDPDLAFKMIVELIKHTRIPNIL
jgi:hypothetical protein